MPSVLIQEIADQSHRRCNSSSVIPTDSMVTVRLSGFQLHPEPCETTRSTERRSESMHSRSSGSSFESRDGSPTPSDTSVDWEGLQRTEEQEPRDEGTDESTALLLARLEQENAALATDPKSALSDAFRARSNTRPPSMQQLKRLVKKPECESIRYSQLPPPPMTELEFWAALVSDYPQTAQRLPTLTSNKIRGGVPPPLRGVVWPSIAGARDSLLHEEFQKLCGEVSPYEGLIGKDVGRSFPNVEMFRERDGEGQRMLGRVLKCFSLYDNKIGYCQGLGFVVGPLLMHMSDAEAFCILVKLMEHYDLRSCYLPDLSGLHLRIYQFQCLLTRHLPELAAHLDKLKVEALYVSQWFLSFFGVTCPLPMLLRIYDVILAEGATETLMRVALSLMKRNQRKIIACVEYEDAMQFLLSRGLWDTYAQHADDLVADFVSFTGMVSRDSLQSLEASFRESQTLAVESSFKSAASQLLGRFWSGSTHGFSKSGTNLGLTLPSRPVSSISRCPSKQSFTSIVNSCGSTSVSSIAATDMSRKSDPTFDQTNVLPEKTATVSTRDRDLHNQIEELLTALNNMQREQAELSRDLQREREDREEDREVAAALLEQLRAHAEIARELAGGEMTEDEKVTERVIKQASQRFMNSDRKRSSILQSKHQLRDAATDWKQKHETEASRCQELMKQLDERENEHNSLRDQLKDARTRIQDGHRDKQRMERAIQDLRSLQSPHAESSSECSPTSEGGDQRMSLARPGLRQFKLGRPDATKSTGPFSKRMSSLHMQSVLATENHQPTGEDALLLELVNAKTAEAVARQELEEMKGKLDGLKKLLGGATPSPCFRGDFLDGGISLSFPSSTKTPAESPKTPTVSSAGGFFSGWAKRSISNGAS